MSDAIIKPLFAKRSRDFLRDVLSRFTDGGPKAPDILLVVQTGHKGATFPDYLKEEYPETIHLVFGGYSENLVLGEHGFDVTLSFGEGYEDLSIPYDAIEGLVCQEEGFALQLPSLTDEPESAAAVEPNAEIGTAEEAPVEASSDEDEEADSGSNVVTLDAFRRK